MAKEKGKTGLFLCRCGTNVAGFMDLENVEDWAKAREEVAFVEFHDLLCSPAGKKFAEEKIAEEKADYYVVAGCSPKAHEKTFQQAAAGAGANMAKVHMANIREQCGWVTSDKAEATEKAKSLIHAAFRRVAYHQDLEPNQIECLTDIVVIGGGLAGMEAAIMAARAGRKVTIIDREISLGGQIIQVEEVAPNMECAPCLLAPRLSEIKDHENITVVSNAEVTDVLGFFGNFTVKAKKKARYVNETCIGCEECFAACPVSVKSDFHLGLGERKAIHTLFPGSVPAMAVIDKKNCTYFKDSSCDACVKACPFQSIDFEEKDQELEIQAGSVIIATGYGMVDPAVLEPLGYGSIENVYLMGEFERLSSSNGPTGGEIKLRNGGKPRSAAIIHCAGSLSEKGLPYCSGTCCVLADKAGALLRHQNPDMEVYNIHGPLVYSDPEEQAFHHKQVEAGSRYVGTDDLASIVVKALDGGIEISGGGMEAVTVDMVVLSTGMAPAPGAEALAEMLNIERDARGFFKADHAILHATGSTLDGINLAGCCASPCNAAASVTRAQAAAGDALSRLIPGRKIDLEVMTCYIDPDVCAGCKLCISVCPYKAVSFDEEKNISAVNEAICRGCGTCAASCPSLAAAAKHYTNEQIYAEIGGTLHA
ncbi:4Fe-4S dicluster domain-containing protein [Fibrobacterota bacterium]